MFRECLVSLVLFALIEAKPLALGTANPVALEVTPQTNSSLNSLLPNLGTLKIECNGADYGQNLQYSSCKNAVKEQIILTGPESFAPRGSPGDITYTTPWVYVSSKLRVPPLSASIIDLSSDGRCKW